mmetsp:Transcript_6533/g.18855  ORF Transcript_6533/g.18855 Transcript_6533/m.18855 type:complete len:217 (+) Transcript_6533:877-1527(+)
MPCTSACAASPRVMLACANAKISSCSFDVRMGGSGGGATFGAAAAGTGGDDTPCLGASPLPRSCCPACATFRCALVLPSLPPLDGDGGCGGCGGRDGRLWRGRECGFQASGRAGWCRLARRARARRASLLGDGGAGRRLARSVARHARAQRRAGRAGGRGPVGRHARPFVGAGSHTPPRHPRGGQHLAEQHALATLRGAATCGGNRAIYSNLVQCV